MPKRKTDFFAAILRPISSNLHPVVIIAGVTALVHVFGEAKYYGGILFVIAILLHTLYVHRRVKSFELSVFPGPMTMLLWATANMLWQTRTRWPEEERLWIWGCIWMAFAVCLEAYGEKVRTWTTLRVTSSDVQEAAEDMLYTLGDLFVDYFRNVTVLLALAYSFYIFTVEAGLPWGMPWVFFVPPVSYISYRILYAKTKPQFAYVVFILCNITLVASYPAKRESIQPIPLCNGTNIGVCGEDFHVGPPLLRQPGCCCLQGTSPWPGGGLCTPCAEEAETETDCVGRPIGANMLKHLSASGYLCNNRDRNEEMQDIFEDDFGCICNEGTCGQTCEVENEVLCKRITLSREEAICSSVPPGGRAPLVCNQMGSGT